MYYVINNKMLKLNLSVYLYRERVLGFTLNWINLFTTFMTLVK